MKKSFCLLISGFLVVSLVFAGSAKAASATTFISFATKPIGGTFYYVTAGMAAIFTKYAGVKVAVEPTRGSIEWGPLMEAGEVELAMDNAVDSGGAYRGSELFRVGKGKLTNFRLLAAGHVTLMSFWTRPDTGIKSIEDFTGKRIVIDTPPGAVTTLATGLHVVDDYYKLKGKYKRLQIGSPAECTNALIEGKIDVYQFVVGPHIEQLKRTVGVQAIPVPKEAAEYAGKKSPGMYPAVIQKGLYGLKEDIPCIGWRAVVVAREDLDAQLVYKLLDTLYSHLKELHRVHPRAKLWVLENATKNPSVPFHPGAISFYKDKGLWTSELERLQEQNLAAGR
ncbi:MAG: TAXI family TRAP transporter solute-binding subunit [Deltaproteobacteria bacterium]|nr:MAG: TAXI family TRAP transporter solute-binding subunit [Deltaproteobacteria bacterium]